MISSIRIAAVIMIYTTVVAQSKIENPDSLAGFRGFDWNSSLESVRSNEKSGYMQTSITLNKKVLSFSGEVENIKTRIDFVFEDDKLIEGSYSFDDLEDIKKVFYSIRNFIVKDYGHPDFGAVGRIDTDKIWVKVNNYGLFRGPELYWQFLNGFIAMLSSKYEDNITLTVLFVHNKTIKQYSEEILMPVDLFLIE